MFVSAIYCQLECFTCCWVLLFRATGLSKADLEDVLLLITSLTLVSSVAEELIRASLELLIKWLSLLKSIHLEEQNPALI